LLSNWGPTPCKGVVIYGGTGDAENLRFSSITARPWALLRDRINALFKKIIILL